jgi:hypothetical protein
MHCYDLPSIRSYPFFSNNGSVYSCSDNFFPAIEQIEGLRLKSTLEGVRTFLNCHKLFSNTVSISLRAKINPAHDLHIGTARLVRAGLVERCATAFGIIMFNLACSWSNLSVA